MGLKYLTIDGTKVISITNTPIDGSMEFDINEPIAIDNGKRPILSFNGSELYYEYVDYVIITEESAPPTISELKLQGKPYNQNGIDYQVPLTKDTQDTVVAVAIAFQMGGISSTVLEFENGVTMPISQSDFMPFTTWFSTQRNNFFVGV